LKKRAAIDLKAFATLQKQKATLQRVESFPYSEDLNSVMDPRVHTCTADAIIKVVLKEMASRNISSIIVVDDLEMPCGILTERDIMQRIVTNEELDLDKTPVSAVMTPDPVFLRPQNTIYRALSVLSARGIKHLPLVENRKVVGIVTMRQLLKLRYPEPMTLIESIREAKGTVTLKAIKDKLPKMAEERLQSGRRAYDIVVMISLINRDIHRRMLELALEELGEPPAEICLYVTGSHGRLENLLNPDQDHGMIIADSVDEVQYDPYFIELTEKFSQGLTDIGFATCPGYIMAVNPLWRKSLHEWKVQIEYWFERQVPELARFVTVLFDAAPVSGNTDLFKYLKDFAFATLARHHEVFRMLLEEEGGHRVPVGFMGRFVTEKEGGHQGKLNVKSSGLIFVVEGIRILVLQHGIRETSTLKRLNRLVEGGFVHPDDAEYFESAYQVLLHLTLSSQLVSYMNDREVSTYIDPKSLSRRDREILRHAFKAVASLKDLVATEFGELVL